MPGSPEKVHLLALRPSKFACGTPPPVICVSARVLSALERFSSKMERRVELTILDRLPVELMDMIIILLFRTWPLATCLMRVSVAFAALAARVRDDLLHLGREWWTGSEEPLSAPAGMLAPELGPLRNPRALAALCVHGSSRRDIERVLLQVSMQEELNIYPVHMEILCLASGAAHATQQAHGRGRMQRARDMQRVRNACGFAPPAAAPRQLLLHTVTRRPLHQRLCVLRAHAIQRQSTTSKEDRYITNFIIALVLSAAAPELIIGNNVSHQMLELVPTDTRVLATSIFDVLAMNGPTFAATSANTPWGRDPIIKILKKAEHVLAPLNLDNNHWIAMRTSKSFNLVELFVFLQTAHERERALDYAKELAQYLILVGHLAEGATYAVRTSSQWKQHDCTSCGLFTLGVLLSLIQGRRISLDCSHSPTRSLDWRRYYAQMVVEAVEANTSTTTVGGASDVVSLVSDYSDSD